MDKAGRIAKLLDVQNSRLRHHQNAFRDWFSRSLWVLVALEGFFLVAFREQIHAGLQIVICVLLGTFAIVLWLILKKERELQVEAQIAVWVLEQKLSVHEETLLPWIQSKYSDRVTPMVGGTYEDNQKAIDEYYQKRKLPWWQTLNPFLGIGQRVNLLTFTFLFIAFFQFYLVLSAQEHASSYEENTAHFSIPNIEFGEKNAFKSQFNENIANVIVNSLINETENGDAILIAQYSLSSNLINQALLAISNSNKIQIIIDDRTNCPPVSNATSNSVFIKKNIAGRIMNHKFVVVPEKWVITGSSDWNENSELNNFENIVLVTDPSTVKAYADHFKFLWEEDQLTETTCIS